MNGATWIGLAGSALLFATAVICLIKVERYPVKVRAYIFILSFFAALLPIAGLPVAGYILGGIGGLSVTSLILLTATVYSRLKERALSPGEFHRLGHPHLWKRIGPLPVSIGPDLF